MGERRKGVGRETRTRAAGPDHQVLTVEGGKRGEDDYCKTPCPKCPWRKDAVGEFPAEAFRHSAETAYDMSSRVFACHAAGAERPMACAGFLLSESADHNLSVRFSRIKRGGLEDVDAGGLELFTTYREMAEANGVDPHDPVLRGHAVTLGSQLAKAVEVSRETGQPVRLTLGKGLNLKVLTRRTTMILAWRGDGRVPSDKECEIVGEDAGFYDPKWEAWTCSESARARLITEGFTGQLCQHEWSQPVHFNMRPKFAWRFSCRRCGCVIEVLGSTRSQKQTYGYDGWDLRESVFEKWKTCGPVPGSLSVKAHHKGEEEA